MPSFSFESQRRDSAAEQSQELSSTQHEARIQALIEALKDSNPHIRTGAASGLGRVGPEAPPEAVSALAAALKDPDKDVRSFAARSLGWIGPNARQAAPALVTALQDSEVFVSLVAASALSKILPE